MSSIDSLNSIRVGLTLDIDGAPYVVVAANFMRCQMRKPVMQTKLKNLIDGRVLEINFKPGDKVETADLQHGPANFLYAADNELHFMDNETFEEFSLSADLIGKAKEFLTDGLEVDVLKFNDKPVVIEVPKKVKLKVVEAPQGVRGDSATGATKVVVLETGAKITAPLFIKEGELIVVNTETGEYAERA
jgi:elongation factor P